MRQLPLVLSLTANVIAVLGTSSIGQARPDTRAICAKVS